MSEQTDKKLRGELDRLKHLSNLGFELDVVWKPDSSNPLAGEVRGKLVHIYEQDETKAIETLFHEFLDYNVSQAINPYKTITNTLVKLLNSEAYACKERIIDGLVRLLMQPKPPSTDDLTRSRRQSQ